MLITAETGADGQNAQKEYWVADVSNWQLRQIIDTDYADEVMSVQLSPDGHKSYLYP